MAGVGMMAKKGQSGQVLTWQLLLPLTTLHVVQGLMIALCSPYSRPFSEASFWISRAWKKVVVKVLVVQSCLTLCDPMDCSPPASSVHGILQARILEWVIPIFGIPFPVVIPFLLGILLTQESNPGLPHCRQILYYLGHQASPRAWFLLTVFEANTVCQTWAPVKQPWPLPSEGLSCLVTGTRKTATQCLDSVFSIKGKGMILFQLEYNQSQPLISVLAHNRVASCFCWAFMSLMADHLFGLGENVSILNQWFGKQNICRSWDSYTVKYNTHQKTPTMLHNVIFKKLLFNSTKGFQRLCSLHLKEIHMYYAAVSGQS